MKQEDWLDVLGMPLDKAIKNYHFPDIEPNLFSEEHCKELRSILSHLPEDNKKLKELLTLRITQGRIEEITEHDQSFIYHIQIRHKKEMYLVDLKLQGLRLSYDGIQYVGKAPQHRTIKWLTLALILALLMITVLGWQQIQHIVGVTDVSINGDHDGEHIENRTTNGDYSLQDLQDYATENNHVLLTKAEYEQHLNDYLETNIDDSINHALEKALAEALEEERKTLLAEQEAFLEKNRLAVEESEDGNVITVTIESGMHSESIAALLAEKGLARSKEEMHQAFIDYDVQQDLRRGTYELSTNASYVEIIETITQAN